MRRVSITKNDSTTNSVPRDISNTRPKMDAKNILLSNHHTDSNPTAHDIVRTEWNGMERQKNYSICRRESSIDRSIHSSLSFFLERNDSLV